MLTSSTAAQRCLCASILTIALAACGGSKDGHPDGGRVTDTVPSTTATSTAPTTAAENAHGPVIDAYLAYWRAVNAYGSQAGPFDINEFKATFAPVAMGAQYDSLFNTFQLNRAQGLIYRGGEGDELRPRVVELTSDRAVVEDCADDTGGIFSLRDNAFTRDTTPGRHSLIRAVLRRDGDHWKVSTQDGGDAQCTP